LHRYSSKQNTASNYTGEPLHTGQLAEVSGSTCRWSQTGMALLDTLGSNKPVENSDYAK